MKNSSEKKMYKLGFDLRSPVSWGYRGSGEPNFSVDDFLDVFEKSLEVVNRNKKMGENGGTIHLTLIDDSEIRLINQKYRKIDKATDVISLSYLDGDPFPGEDLVGEIFISLDTAKRQADENNKSIKDEVLFLLAHGMLHIFGFDHENKEDKQRMFALQDEVLGLK